MYRVMKRGEGERDFFAVDDVRENLKERSVKGGFSIGLSQILKFFLQVMSNMALARLLTPDDFGLVAMVSVFINFMVIFKDFGLAQVTVQRKELNHRQVTNLFWINVAIGGALMVVFWVMSPALALFYRDNRIFWIAIALGFGFFLDGLSVQHRAILRRQMRFYTLVWIDISSSFFSILTAIFLAWLGAKYWALIALQLGVSLASLFGVWVSCPWRPSLRFFRDVEIRSMVNFGGYMTLFS